MFTANTMWRFCRPSRHNWPWPLSASERKSALAKSEKRYRELIDNGQGLICTHGLDGKLLSVNPAAAESLGYTPAEMVGRNLIEYISPSAQPAFPYYLKRIAAEPHAQWPDEPPHQER